MATLKVYSDAACDNKSPTKTMGLGFHLNIDGEEVDNFTLNAGSGTSNLGEWLALILAARYCLDVDLHFDRIIFYVDSQLVARQASGEYAVKKDHLKPLHSEFLRVISRFPLGKYQEVYWIPRTKNTRADELSKDALKKPIQIIEWYEKIKSDDNKQ